MAADITFARDKCTGELKHISAVPRGNDCNCVCLECGHELQARKGNVRENHFKHHSSNCRASFESALHKAAKEIIAGHSQMEVPKYGLLTYTNPIVEENWNIYRPDIKIQTEFGQIFIEIAVTSFASEEKERAYSSKNVICFEIDLSTEDRKVDLQTLKQRVLSGIDNKVLLCDFEPTVEKVLPSFTNNSSGNSKDSIIIASLIGIGVLLYNLLKPKRDKG